jgi:predicted ribonuclease YlaK
MSASIGNILSTKLGSIDAVKSMLMNDTLEIIPTANLRGVEFDKDSVVLVTEAQNLDVYTIKTIMQRCKEGCKQIYEGDIHEQSDVNLNQSGMQRIIDVFKGYEKFGCIKLKNNYRSNICELADRL